MHPTIISQYANSPTIVALVDFMEQGVSPDTDFDAFYDYVWNVLTAQGFGLDIWGKIVGVGRDLNIPGTETNFGFSNGSASVVTLVDQSGNYLTDEGGNRLLGTIYG